MTSYKTNTLALEDGTEVDVCYTIDVPRDCESEDDIDIQYEYDDAGLNEQQIINLEELIEAAIVQHKLDIIEG